jgi:hypothetical protein
MTMDSSVILITGDQRKDPKGWPAPLAFCFKNHLEKRNTASSFVVDPDPVGSDNDKRIYQKKIPLKSLKL